MEAKTVPQWEDIHFNSTLVDLHVHPSLNVSLFHRALTSRFYPSSRAFDPFSVRTDYDRLHKGGVDALLSVIYAPEKGILDECPPLRWMRYLMPKVWKKIYARPYFEVTLQMMDEIEREVEKARDPQTGQSLIRFAHSARELAGILKKDENRPIALVHCLEGGHCLDGRDVPIRF